MLLNRFISQQARATAFVTPLYIAAIWLYINLLIAIGKASLSLILAWSVIMPTLVLVVGAFLLQGLIWLYNRLTCNLAHRRLIKSIELTDVRQLQLDEAEKSKLLTTMKTTTFFSAVLQALDNGYRSITVAKKRADKNIYYPNENDDATRVHIDGMPRKVFIEFTDAQDKERRGWTQNLGADNGYQEMYWDIHLKPGNKKPGGQKRGFSCKDKNSPYIVDYYNSFRTTTGLETTCYPTIAVRSRDLSGQVTQTVALRKSGQDKLRSGYHISFQENKGPTIGAVLSRKVYLEQMFIDKSVHKPLKITAPMVLEMLKQISVQLETWYKNNQICHGDIKMENICMSKRQGGQSNHRYTLIDYPDKADTAQPYTQQSSVLMNTHDFITKVIVGQPFRLHTGVDNKNRPRALTGKAEVPESVRIELEAALASFENRSPRSQGNTVDGVSANSRSAKFIGVHPNTLYHDTFALTYLAFLMTAMIDQSSDNDHRMEQAIFNLLKDMIIGYIEIYNKNVGAHQNILQERGVRKNQVMNSIITDMNQKYELGQIMTKLEEILDPKKHVSTIKKSPAGAA